MKGADIAARQRIPLRFLELILTDLRQAQIVDAKRGVNGGYRLLRSPRAISIEEVIRLIEPREARLVRGNALDGLWQCVDTSVSSILHETNFADLVLKYCEQCSGQKRAVDNAGSPEDIGVFKAVLLETAGGV